VWLLSEGESPLQAAAALLVGQLAAPPLAQADLEANLGECMREGTRHLIAGNNSVPHLVHSTPHACYHGSCAHMV
jgi:hypothetical protein